MACEFPCEFKKLATEVQSEISDIIDGDAEWTRRQDENARAGWGDYAASRKQDDRRREIRRIDEVLEIDGLLCTKDLCGFAFESVRQRIEETSIDIKLKREQM